MPSPFQDFILNAHHSLNHDMSIFFYPLSLLYEHKTCPPLIIILTAYVPKFQILKLTSFPILIHNKAGCLAYLSLHSASLVTRHCIQVIQQPSHVNVIIASKDILVDGIRQSFASTVDNLRQSI